MKRTGLAALSLLLVACSGEPLDPPKNPAVPPTTTPVASSSPAAPAEPPPQAPAFRLPANVAPRKVAATLTLVPSEDSFRGSVEIDLSVTQPTRVIWLNASELSITGAELDVSGAKRAARVVAGGEDFVGFQFAEDVPAGDARLSVTYTGRISSTDDHGVFREREGEEAYLYTQFESTAARRAFPCFDEPSFKVPWQLTLRVRSSDVALANTPAIEEKAEEGGFKSIRFAQTKPLSSYLVAFAVGPFDMVDAGRAGRNKTPIRFAVPRGKAPEIKFAAGASGKILDLLEDEFGMAYPYEKLDYVVIPQLVSFGAMENVGLITVAGRASLIKPGEETATQRARVAVIMAHEVAHQWFGDLVTMKWWDDIWLNEGFATWMEAKIAHRFDPSLGADMHAIAEASWVMGEDGLLSARKVRQEIASKDDILNAFDGITYQKGGAVLGMFEAWMGPGAFQKGVRGYLEKFSHKNATSSDFLTALGEGSGKDVKTAFSTFLDQPGVPIVTGALSCDKGNAKIALSQERFLPIGSKGSAASASWQIPVCVRYGAGGESGSACTLLSDKKGELALPQLEKKKGACPDWVMPKSGGVGYYRAAYTPQQVESLLGKAKSPLTAAERMNVISDVRALAGNARFPMGDALSLLPKLLKDESAHVQSAAAGMAGWLNEDFVEAELRPSARRWVSKVVAPRARALGWQAKGDEPAEQRELRRHLLHVMIELGDDPKLFAEADALAQKWLEDPKAIEHDSVEVVLRAAASRGDKKLFDRLVAAAKAEKDGQRLRSLLWALASFRDPALVKASLALFMEGSLDPRASLALFWGQQRSSLGVVWEFMKERYDALMEKVPVGARPWLMGVPGDFCDEPHRADVESFLKDRAAKVAGAPRMLAQTLESISLCVAKREANKESLRAFLKKQ